MNVCRDLFQLNRVKAVAREKDELEGVKNEALGFLEAENNITHLKNKLYQKFLWVVCAACMYVHVIRPIWWGH